MALDSEPGSCAGCVGWARHQDLLNAWLQDCLCQGGSNGRYFGLAGAVQTKPRLCKALTLLIERESF